MKQGFHRFLFLTWNISCFVRSHH